MGFGVAQCERPKLVFDLECIELELPDALGDCAFAIEGSNVGEGVGGVDGGEGGLCSCRRGEVVGGVRSLPFEGMLEEVPEQVGADEGCKACVFAIWSYDEVLQAHLRIVLVSGVEGSGLGGSDRGWEDDRLRWGEEVGRYVDCQDGGEGGGESGETLSGKGVGSVG